MSTVEQDSSFWLGTDNQDLTAINDYMHAQPLNTPEATTLFNQWVTWYDGLGFMDLHVNTTATYDLARNMRDQFNLANAQSDAERAQIQSVMQTGQTSEQDAGQTKRNLADGSLPGPKAPPPAPWIPTWAKYAAAGVGALTIILSAVSFSAVKAYKP